METCTWLVCVNLVYTYIINIRIPYLYVLIAASERNTVKSYSGMQQQNISQPPQHRLQHRRTSATSIKSAKQSQHQPRWGSLKCWYHKTAAHTCNHSPEVRYANTDIRDVGIRPIFAITRLPPDDTPIVMCCVRHYSSQVSR